MSTFASLIRDIADFPKPGIVFKDITPLLGDAQGFAEAIAAMIAPWQDAGVQAIAGIESRGFILGAAMALAMRIGFVPIRKPGKLPARTIGIDYALEYGSDRLEVHADALRPGTRVLIVDDVLATGGTLIAAGELVRQAGGIIIGASLLVELSFLDGRARWRSSAPVHAALRF